jgi:hypothetical protein
MIKINKTILLIGITTFVLLNACSETQTETSETLATSDPEPKTEILGPETMLSKEFKD